MRKNLNNNLKDITKILRTYIYKVLNKMLLEGDISYFEIEDFLLSRHYYKWDF